MQKVPRAAGAANCWESELGSCCRFAVASLGQERHSSFDSKATRPPASDRTSTSMTAVATMFYLPGLALAALRLDVSQTFVSSNDQQSANARQLQRCTASCATSVPLLSHSCSWWLQLFRFAVASDQVVTVFV
jgi:hypothetical protein